MDPSLGGHAPDLRQRRACFPRTATEEGETDPPLDLHRRRRGPLPARRSRGGRGWPLWAAPEEGGCTSEKEGDIPSMPWRRRRGTVPMSSAGGGGTVPVPDLRWRRRVWPPRAALEENGVEECVRGGRGRGVRWRASGAVGGEGGVRIELWQRLRLYKFLKP